MVPALLACVAVTLISGCAGPASDAAPSQEPASSGTAPSSAAKPWSACEQREPATPLHVVAGGRTVEAALLGEGPRVVVLTNTSTSSACVWTQTARRLLEKDYRVAVWNYTGTSDEQRVAELIAVVAEVRAAGAREVVLVGGSLGGCLSLRAASRIKPAVAGLVILCCAERPGSGTPPRPYAAAVTVPVLLISAAEDTRPPIEEVKAEFAGLASRHKNLLVIPDTGAHAVAMLTSLPGSEIAVPAFLGVLQRVTG
jgi:pimeloyl-ACP methyl ester carboxylesterase